MTEEKESDLIQAQIDMITLQKQVNEKIGLDMNRRLSDLQDRKDNLITDTVLIRIPIELKPTIEEEIIDYNKKKKEEELIKS